MHMLKQVNFLEQTINTKKQDQITLTVIREEQSFFPETT